MTPEQANIENDPAELTEAIRKLLEVALAQDVALISECGRWPEEMQNSRSVESIRHPVAFACQYAANLMLARLGALIGPEAARAQYNAIIAEQRALPEVRAAQETIERASGKPASSTLRSVH